MKPEHADKMVQIFAGKQWQVALVKSLLENANIEAYLKDEFTGTLAPWYTSAGGANCIKVLVAERDVDNAREVVKQYEENIAKGR